MEEEEFTFRIFRVFRGYLRLFLKIAANVLLPIMDAMTRRAGNFLGIAILVGCGASLLSAENIPLPVIPAATFNVTNYGAVGDGRTLNTAALQKTVDACAAAGGGTVLVPAGNYLTGPFTLTSRINLHLEKKARLLLSDDLATYPVRGARYENGISATKAHDLEISGEGTIDGQGAKWWAAFRADAAMTHRPNLVSFSDCTNVAVLEVTLTNSPMFHLVPQNCLDVTIRGITIGALTPSPNTDGIDPSGWNYLIEDCRIDVGDDNIAVKPSSARVPGDKNFIISHCIFRHGHGMSVGSGSSGGVEDLCVSNCVFDGTDSGIRIKSGRGRGGVLQKCTYTDLTMNNVKHPIYIVDYYPESAAPKDPSTSTNLPVDARTPIVKNIVIRNLTAVNCPSTGTIYGLPEAPVSNVTLDHVDVSATTGLQLYFVRDVQFIASQIKVERGDKLILYDAVPSGLE